MYTIKSSKSGKPYRFADDVPQEEAVQFIDSQEPDMDWKQVPNAIGANVGAGYAKIGGGLLTGAGHLSGLVGDNPVQKWLYERGERASKAADWFVKENTSSGFPTLMQQGAISAGASLGENIPMLMGGAGIAMSAAKAGSKVLPAMAKGLEASLLTSSGAQGFKELQEQQDAGMSPARGLLHAGIAAGAEYLPERIAFTPILKALGANDPGVKGMLANWLGREFLGEQVTTGAQWLNRRLSREPDLTFGDLWHEMLVTGISTGISGPVQGVMTKGAFQVALKDRARRELEEEKDAEQGVQQPEGKPEEATPEAVPGAVVEEDTAPDLVREARRRLIRDEDVPIIGSPDDSATTPRQLGFDDRLELFRLANEKLRNVDVNTTTEERIHLRQDVVKRRIELNADLMTNPEYRSSVLISDLQLGLRQPDITAGLEYDVETYARLTPEQIARKQEQRTNDEEGVAELADTKQTVWFPKQLREALKLDDWNDSIDSPIDRHAMDDRRESMFDSSFTRHFGGKLVESSTSPELVGTAFEEAIAAAPEGSVIFAGQIGTNRPQQVQLMQDLAQRFVQTFMPKQKLAITFQDRPGGEALIVPNVDNAVAFTVSAIPEVSGMPQLFDYGDKALGEAQVGQLDTLMHEFTHVVHFQHWNSTPAAEKAAVAREYHGDLAFAQTATVRDALNRLYSPQTAKMYLHDYMQKGGNPADKFISAEAKSKLAMHTRPNYWYNFNEWMAHKGVKYLTTRLGAHQENVGFFQKLLQKMRKFYAMYMSEFKTGPAFAQWMDNIAKHESKAQFAPTSDQVAAVKQELVKDGFSPEYAEALAVMSGDPMGTIRRSARERYLRLQQAELNKMQSEKTFMSGLSRAITRSFKAGAKVHQVEAALAKTSLGKDLLATPLAQNAETKNVWQLFDAFFQRGFKKSFKTYTFGQNKRFEFSHSDQLFELEFDAKNNTLMVFDDANLDSDVAPAIELAAAQYALRQLAKEGATSVKAAGFARDTMKALDAEQIDKTEYHVTVPYYVQATPLEPISSELPSSDDTSNVPPEQRMPAALDNLGKRLGAPFASSSAHALGRMNALFSKALGAYQLIKLNIDVPGMQQEKQALRNRLAYRHQWLKKANATVEQWAFQISKTDSAKVAKLLFDEAENGKWLSVQRTDADGRRVFEVDPVEAKKRGLSEKAQEVYSKVRRDFMEFAEEWQKVGLWEIARTEMDDVAHTSLAEAMRNNLDMKQYRRLVDVLVNRTKDPAALKRIETRVAELNEQFESWKASPYMPYTRFGRWGILVKGAKGETKYFAGYDSKRARDKALEDIQGQFKGDAVSSTYLEDVPYMMAGLPPAMTDAMRRRLDLTPEQQESFSEVLAQISHANSFKHRAERKAGVEGYTTDALRAYSDYFRRGSAYLARVKSEPEMNDSMRILKNHIAKLTTEGADVTNLGRLHEWFTKHHQYLNNVGNEWGEVKSFMALFHFGFNAATAMVNMTQVPLVTLPYLTDRFGTTDSIREMTKAYKDVLQMHMKNSKLAPDEMAMLDYALSQGFRDESQATVIAQIADGSALARASPVAAWQRALNTTNHYAMWMFSKGELLNRDVTLLATYRLARAKNPREYSGDFDPSAFDEARTTTEDTHNEYARENRPEIMRGAGSTIFQFLHFVQNMAFLQLGGDKSWWRLLLVQAAFTGVLGLPFARDIQNMAKALGRIVFGADWDFEREARKYIDEMGADPDLILRGLTSNVAGMDLHRRIGLGEIIPGMEPLGSHRRLETLMYDAVGDVGGPAVSLFMNGLSFMAEGDKTKWDAISKVLPTSMRNIGKASEAFVKGKVTDRSGAVLLEPDTWDILGMSVGFVPEKLSEEYNSRSLEMEKAAYWTTRRQALLETFYEIMIERDGDREAQADFFKRLDTFNKEAPDPKLIVRGETLRNGLRSRLRSNVEKEAGLGSNAQMRAPTREIRETFRNIQ